MGPSKESQEVVYLFPVEIGGSRYAHKHLLLILAVKTAQMSEYELSHQL